MPVPIFSQPLRWLLCGLFLSAIPLAAAEPNQKLLRYPIGLVLSHDGGTLYAANRLTGTISSIDIATRNVVGEVDVATQLSDLQAIAKTQFFLATDEAKHELLLLKVDDSHIDVQQRLPVSPYPVTVVVTADGRRCVVASLWSRRLTFVDLPSDNNAEARVTKVLDLPFAPRTQLLVKGDTQLIVADSFGGRLGIVDMANTNVAHVREFPGHNIRGMGVSPNGEMLIVAHQMLNELAHTVRNDVHWGLLMSNDLRWLKLDAVLTPNTNLYEKAHMHPLGEAGSATGDPAGLTLTANGAVVVSLGGVGEIAIGKEDDFSLYRIHVGRRPTALVADRDARFLYVANTFDDEISIVDIGEREVIHYVSLGEQPELSLVQRGEQLFFDANLSHDSWMSCHSCHTDGHTNGLLNDNFSDASFGAPKRVFSLLGRANTEPFAWAGTADTLQEQIHKSLTHTMQADDPPTEEQLAALAAYVETLAPPPSIDLMRGVQDPAAIDRGRELFGKLECVNCHQPPVYTTPDTYDVGIDDKLGKNKFNPPALLGVGQRGPYFHDNRAVSLADVLTKHKHQLARDLSATELKDLLAFLRSL
ncbi:MAG TPA: cytochrome c peroxidase [Pirellulaceae bacterium]|nr:cytochrome c peroxidase [Pirellulaceae bacterium]